MPRLTIQQRTKVIEFWHQEKSVTKVQRRYCTHFDVHPRSGPTRLTIKRIVEKFTTVGTVCDQHKGHSGRKRSGRSLENIEIVRNSVAQSPRKSVRRLSAETAISSTSVYRILRTDINAFPYKIETETELTEPQKTKRLTCATWFSTKLEEDEDFLKKLHMSDECHATLSGTVNKQNFRYWGVENPADRRTEEIPRSTLKVTMWVAIGWYGIIGPYFFEDEHGHTVTVNQENYRAMIKDYYLPELRVLARRRNMVLMSSQWFQQDGAPPHTARETRALLRQHFRNRLISLHEEVEWPPYSPDLTPPDFFLWGYLKDRIYSNPQPRTLDQLKDNIRREINDIPQETFPKVMRNMAVRMQSVIGRHGRYVEHVI